MTYDRKLGMTVEPVDRDVKLIAHLTVGGLYITDSAHNAKRSGSPRWCVDTVTVIFRGDSYEDALNCPDPEVYATRMLRIRADGSAGATSTNDRLIWPQMLTGADADRRYAFLLATARETLAPDAGIIPLTGRDDMDAKAEANRAAKARDDRMADARKAVRQLERELNSPAFQKASDIDSAIERGEL